MEEKTLNNYEGLFILKPDLEKEELSQLHKKITDNIKKYKGELESAPDDWGKKRLNYRIKKQREGSYCLIKFKIDPLEINQLNSELKLNEDIIRIMFTRQQ
ncbi:MAG: 30S ribosomal protein S6 [Candidatus Omnitrophota bacterium]